MKISRILLWASLAALLLACLMTVSCSAHDPLAPMVSQVGDVAVPAPRALEAAADEEGAVLWFRYGEEPLLAPETRKISTSPTEPYEMSLLRALLNGPAAASTELRGLFPAGTQVLSTTRQGRMLFVTLSSEIMNAYPDEPDDWAREARWRTEAPLRRTLAMQAIAATITENCDVDAVIILVEQQQVTDSLRLRAKYYLQGGDELAEPLRRDESLLLTPVTAMETILQCWQERDWPRLYRYLSRRDLSGGAARPDDEQLVARLEALPHLTAYTVSGGHVSGQHATLTVQAQLMQNSRLTGLDSAIFRLHCEDGVWRISVSQLEHREEAAR